MTQPDEIDIALAALIARMDETYDDAMEARVDACIERLDAMRRSIAPILAAQERRHRDLANLDIDFAPRLRQAG